MSDETKASATVSDYLRWRGDLTFAQDGFNEVDNLLLCIISYIKLENIPRLRSFDPQDAMPMGDVCRLLTEELGAVITGQGRGFAVAACVLLAAALAAPVSGGVPVRL